MVHSAIRDTMLVMVPADVRKQSIGDEEGKARKEEKGQLWEGTIG